MRGLASAVDWGGQRNCTSSKEQGSYSEAPELRALAEYNTHWENTQVADKAPTVVAHVSAASGSTTMSLQDFVSSTVRGCIKYKLA